jgi:hypothetical protein
MRVRIARLLLTGLLAMSLQAGFCGAATMAATPPRPLDPATQARQLLPATLSLLQAAEQAAMVHGRVLTPVEMQIARRLGVVEPERVRVLVTPVLPSWMAPDLMAKATAAGDAGTDNSDSSNADANRAQPQRRFGIAGLTAGHGILIGIRHANNPRVLAHELAHVAQYERLGMRAFALRYLTELLSVGYFRAPLELEADAEMRRVMAVQQTSVSQ